ncbi:hypothetical protein P7C73_g2098, partial [Tremellales sp. Uapishka_1]
MSADQSRNASERKGYASGEEATSRANQSRDQLAPWKLFFGKPNLTNAPVDTLVFGESSEAPDTEAQYWRLREDEGKGQETNIICTGADWEREVWDKFVEQMLASPNTNGSTTSAGA